MASKLDAAIYKRFRLAPPSPSMLAAVHMADAYSTWCEAKVLMVPCRMRKRLPGTEPPDSLLENVAMIATIGMHTPTWQSVEALWLKDFNYAIGQVP